jgi:hypothetical protein
MVCFQLSKELGAESAATRPSMKVAVMESKVKRILDKVKIVRG